jgi:hypothetical protein
MSELEIETAEFWFVWTKTGHMPRKAHETLDAAETEATRLARLQPGKKFIVLQAVSKFRVTPEAAQDAEAAAAMRSAA